MPEITVLLPAKNCSKYVNSAAQSLRDQTFRDFECVFIYGSSLDDSLAVIGDIESTDSRFKVILGTGAGLASDLNLGLSSTDSKYVLRLDADDWARPDRLTSQLEFLDAGFDVIGSNVKFFGGLYSWCSDYPLVEAGIKLFSAMRNPFAHPSVAFRRTSEIYYDPVYEGVEDYELWTRLISQPAIRYGNIKAALTHYRVHAGQTTKMRNQAKISSLRSKISENVSSNLGLHEKLKVSLALIASEQPINFDEAEYLIKLVRERKEIGVADSLKIIREVILATRSLTMIQTRSLTKMINDYGASSSSTFFASAASLLSSSPKSKTSRFIRRVWT